MAFRTVTPEQYEWVTRPHEEGEPACHIAALSEKLGSAPCAPTSGATTPAPRGKRHVHAKQEETFLVLSGTLSMYVGEPPERVELLRAS